MLPLFKVWMSNCAKAGVDLVLKSGYVGQGKSVEQFEKTFAELEHTTGVILATTSGTHALDLAYHLCGVGSGTTVVSTPMTCTATNTQIKARGARIIWADVDPQTGLIDPDSVARRVRDNTVAIVGVDWGGRMADYTALKRIGLPVIQDGAHSLLSEGDQGSSWGDYRMWSFQAIKHLTCGDGGALLVPEEMEDRAHLLRWYGLDRRKSDSFRCEQDIVEAGYKYGMNNIAAEIGLANMHDARSIVGKHKANARYLHCALSGLRKVELPPFSRGSSYWLFTVFVDDQSQFKKYMASQRVTVSQVHSRNDSKSCFIDDISEPMPGLEEFARRQMNIPVGWWLKSDDLARIEEAVVAYS